MDNVINFKQARDKAGWKANMSWKRITKETELYTGDINLTGDEYMALKLLIEFALDKGFFDIEDDYTCVTLKKLLKNALHKIDNVELHEV